jgi:hypothetical protein
MGRWRSDISSNLVLAELSVFCKKEIHDKMVSLEILVKYSGKSAARSRFDYTGAIVASIP